jgi:hypothetical protein
MAAVALSGFATTASAQAWAEAYRAGEYEKAADLLHRIVTDPDQQLTFAAFQPFRHLATMYAQGLGVQADPIAACAMAEMALTTAHMGAPHDANDPNAYNRFIAESEQFREQHCANLSQEDRLSAGRSMGCFAFGMPEATLQVGPHAVRVGRGGITLAEEPVGKRMGLGACPPVVARVRAFTLEPPANAAPDVKARHFVETLAWGGGADRDSATRYKLHWEAHEVRDGSVNVVASELLHAVESWPGLALPEGFDTRFRIEMIRSGHVRWRMDGTPPKRGWIMLPEEGRR